VELGGLLIEDDEELSSVEELLDEVDTLEDGTCEVKELDTDEVELSTSEDGSCVVKELDTIILLEGVEFN